jgi:hypothetical protein
MSDSITYREGRPNEKEFLKQLGILSLASVSVSNKIKGMPRCVSPRNGTKIVRRFVETGTLASSSINKRCNHINNTSQMPSSEQNVQVCDPSLPLGKLHER